MGKTKKVTPKKRAVKKIKKDTPKRKVLSTKAKKQQLFVINNETGKTGSALLRAFNTKWAPNKVTKDFVYRTLTPKNVEAWQLAEFGKCFGRKKGSWRKKKITEDMEEDIRDWIEDDDVKMKEIPDLIQNKFGVKISEDTVTRRFKKKPGNPKGYTSHVTPLSTPLTEDDQKIRLAFALHGPINNWSFNQFEDLADAIMLPKSWRERRRLLAWWDHKPFYLGKFHRHNCRQNRFPKDKKKKKKPLNPARKEKFAPKFMVFGLLGYNFSESYFHCNRKRNARRSRNENDELVHKYKFEHISVNQEELNAAAEEFIPILKKHGIRVLIGDCDAKLHNVKLAEKLAEHGILLWPGGGKSCGKHPCGYPPRSHDCNPCESWFSQWQEDAAKLMKPKKKKTMFKWKLALEEAQKKMKKSRWQRLIDTQPKVMKTILQNGGGRTKY